MRTVVAITMQIDESVIRGAGCAPLTRFQIRAVSAGSRVDLHKRQCGTSRKMSRHRSGKLPGCAAPWSGSAGFEHWISDQLALVSTRQTVTECGASNRVARFPVKVDVEALALDIRLYS